MRCLVPLSAVFFLACTPFEGARSVDGFTRSPVEEAFPGARIEGQGVHRITLDDGSSVTLPYVVQDGMAVVEGDMLLGEAAALGERAAAVQWSNARWDCTVPYAISEQLHPIAEQDFLAAVAHWEANTGLRFVEDPSATSRIQVVPGAGCSSYLGKTGWAQDLTLSPQCGRGAAIHEIGHAMGLFHEQARSDRDQHITVHWENIPSGLHYAFESYVERDLSGLDLGTYDLGSIMHYSSYAFSSGVCYPGETQGCSITHPDGSYLSEHQRHSLSPTDLAAIATMYPSCGGGTAPPPVTDDHGDTFSDATVITGSTTIQGFLDPDDHDLFELDVAPGTEVWAWTSGTTDTVGVVYFDQVYAGEDDTTGEGPNFSLAATADEGTLHLDVQGWTRHTTGAYTLHIETTPPADGNANGNGNDNGNGNGNGNDGGVDPTPDDHGDDLATATPLPLAFGSTTTLSAELTAADVDAFLLDVPTSGMLWVLTSEGTDLRGTLVDEDGDTITIDDPIGDAGVVIGVSVDPGSYLVLLDGGSPLTEGLYAVSFTLQ